MISVATVMLQLFTMVTMFTMFQCCCDPCILRSFAFYPQLLVIVATIPVRIEDVVAQEKIPMTGDITVYVRPPQEAEIASMVTQFKSVILLFCLISVNGYCLLYLYTPTEDTDQLNHTLLQLYIDFYKMSLYKESIIYTHWWNNFNGPLHCSSALYILAVSKKYRFNSLFLFIKCFRTIWFCLYLIYLFLECRNQM